MNLFDGLRTLIAVAGVVFNANFALGGNPDASYVSRWMITETGVGAIKPPLILQWEKSPVFFERWNASPFYESSSRRIAESKEGLVTVIRKTVYMLNKEDGETLWTTPLQGADIKDWKIADDLLVYSSVDYRQKEQIRGAVDLLSRKEKWLQKEPVPVLYQPERLILTKDGLAVFVPDGDSKSITAINSRTGELRWKSLTDVEQRSLVPFSWFVYGERLSALIAPKNQGLYLKAFDVSDGKALTSNHIFGQDYLGNIFHPSVIGPDGTLYIGYNKLPLPGRRLSLLAYDTNARKLLWTRDVGLEDQKDLMSFRHIIRSDNNAFMVATIRPNRFVVFDSKTGSILKDARLANYIGWSDDNAALYSYPYLYTGARRRLSNGMAFDLIALNLETGKVDWSYQIDTESQYSTIPTADILNFIVGDDRIYIGRADARVMSFRQGGSPPVPK